MRRVLTVKFEKGLFDHPFTDANAYKTAFLQQDAIDLAREAAAKSCVLLKNDNGVLPLSPHVKKLALIGPFAEDGEELVGPWSSRAHTNDIVSLADAVRAQLPFDFQLTVARGCAIFESGKIRRHLGDSSPIKETPTSTNEIADAGGFRARQNRRQRALTGCSRRWWTSRATRAGAASRKVLVKIRGSARWTRRRACAVFREPIAPTPTASSRA